MVKKNLELLEELKTFVIDPDKMSGSWNLANTLDQVEEFILQRFILGPNESTAITLYIALTHTFKPFFAIPYLFIKSADAGSGKSSLLTLIGYLSWNPLQVDVIKPAAMAAAVTKGCTLLMDQIDTTMAGSMEMKAEIEGVVNGGYKRNGQRIKLANDNKTLVYQNTFGPKIFSGIICPFPDTTESRCIPIYINMATNEELKRIIEFDEEEVESETAAILEQLTQLESLETTLKAMKVVDRPDDLNARGKEIWKPLMAIAELAGPEWHKRAWDCAIELSGVGSQPQNKSWGQTALRDIRQIFDDEDWDRIKSQVLVNKLIQNESSGWGEYKGNGLNTTNFAKLLKVYKQPDGKFIIPERWRDGSQQVRGYYRTQFEEAWRQNNISQSVSLEVDTPDTDDTGDSINQVQSVPNIGSVPSVTSVPSVEDRGSDYFHIADAERDWEARQQREKLI